jgi:mannose-6-phosphate isomerase-like protein (cupin superfamily)
MPPHKLSSFPVHLGLGAKAVVQPEFVGGFDWYQAYEARNASDGIEGRLVTWYEFTADWDSWEMHPTGDELVVCLAGALTLHQEFADGGRASIRLIAGEYAINPPGVWHTADIADSAVALFITAGLGTEHRPR